MKRSFTAALLAVFLCANSAFAFDYLKDGIDSGVTGTVKSGTGMRNGIPELQFNSSLSDVPNGQMINAQADQQGALLVNPGVQGGPLIQTSVSVATTAADLYPANPYRKYLEIQNQDSTNPIWVSFNDGVTATATSSFYKIPAGVTVRWGPSDYVPTGRLNMISTTATVSAQIMEGN